MDMLLTEFPITIYQQLTQVSEVLSKSRCRIFYKYGNRNGGYITDEFADKLISTLPYAPVKGIFDGEDFTDHGQERSEGRIYGIVPAAESMNFAWEDHLDDDGVTRTYACTDVYLFTGIYEEAALIPSKGQSMELYRPSIKGAWEFINGRKYFKYTDACFLGLSALGDDKEPCFEGAAFYSLNSSAAELLERIKQYELAVNEKQIGGNLVMDKINFKLSDADKEQAIWSLLNVNYCEEGNYTVDYGICAVYDDYALVRNYGAGIYERVYYSKDDSTDSLTLGDRVECHVVDITSAEKMALEAIQKLNNNTFEKVDETFAALQSQVESLGADLEAEKQNSENFGLKISELEEANSTFKTENENLQAELDRVNGEFAALQSENETLAAFKKGVEDAEKKAVIESYSEQLSEEVIEKYTNEMDNYTARDLDKELAYELKCSNPDIFSLKTQPQLIPQQDENLTGIEAILSQYKK